MSAHIAFPLHRETPLRCLTLADGSLRDSLKFKGLVVTDARKWADRRQVRAGERRSLRSRACSYLLIMSADPEFGDRVDARGTAAGRLTTALLDFVLKPRTPRIKRQLPPS